MPRVPTPEAQVALRPLADAQVRAPQNNLAAVGSELSQAGDNLGGMVMRQQELRNADRLFSTEASLKDEYLKFQGQLNQRKGQDAWGVTNDARQWFDDNGKKYLDGLENDQQRRLFGPQLESLRQQGLQHAAQHEAQQRGVSLEQSANASIAASTNSAAAAWNDPSAIAKAKDDISKRIAVTAGFNGWTPEVRDNAQAVAITNLHKQVLQVMADKDPVAAAAYYKANKAEIEGSQQQEIEKLVENGGLRVRSQQGAASILSQNLSEADALKQARDKYTGVDQDAVVERVKAGYADKRAQDAQAEKDTADMAWDFFSRGGNRTDQIPIAVLDQLDGKTLHSMNTVQKNEKVQTNWDTYTTLRESLIANPKVDLRQYKGDLAPAQYEQLVNLQANSQSADAVTLEQQTNVALSQLRIKDKGAIGQFKSAVDVAILSAATRKGGKLTDDERQKVIDKLMLPGTIPGWLWNHSRRFYQVEGTADQAGFAVDVTQLKGYDTLTPVEQQELKQRAATYGR